MAKELADALAERAAQTGKTALDRLVGEASFGRDFGQRAFVDVKFLEQFAGIGRQFGQGALKDFIQGMATRFLHGGKVERGERFVPFLAAQEIEPGATRDLPEPAVQ
jgi:hypothetical protein